MAAYSNKKAPAKTAAKKPTTKPAKAAIKRAATKPARGEKSQMSTFAKKNTSGKLPPWVTKGRGAVATKKGK